MTWHRDESRAERSAHTISKDMVSKVVTSKTIVDAVASVGVPGGSQFKSSAGTLTGAHEHHNREHEGYLIKELQHLLRTQIETRIRAKGLWLSFPHSAVLMTLHQEPGLSGAQLARRNLVTAQTMNGLMMPLEAKGLIERRPDPENARVLKCYLKPKGIEVLQQGMHEAGSVFDLMLGQLSSLEREEFRRILRRCIDALQSGGTTVNVPDNKSPCNVMTASSAMTKSVSRRVRVKKSSRSGRSAGATQIGTVAGKKRAVNRASR